VILLDRNLEVVEFQFAGGNGRAHAVVIGAVGKAVVEGNMTFVVEFGVGGKREQERQEEE